MPEHVETRYPGTNHAHNFGNQHSHKSNKALIGIAVLLGLSIFLYEINGKSIGLHTSSMPASTQTNVVASGH